MGRNECIYLYINHIKIYTIDCFYYITFPAKEKSFFVSLIFSEEKQENFTRVTMASLSFKGKC